MAKLELTGVDPKTGGEVSVSIKIERPKIELKYGVKMDREFRDWCNDFLKIDEETQIDILFSEPEVSCAFEIPDQIWLEILLKVPAEHETLFLNHTDLNSTKRKELSEKIREIKDLKLKTKNAFRRKLQEIPKEKREAYVRYD